MRYDDQMRQRQRSAARTQAAHRQEFEIDRRRLLLGLAAIGAGLLLWAGSAHAQSADALRASGAAGERFDGFMEAREASAAAAVETINAERRTVYAQRAQEQGIPPEEVGRVYAQQILSRAAPGTWIKTEAGQWIRK